MTASTSRHARQYHNDPMNKEYSERIFNRSPWEKIEHRERNQAPVTIWVGISNVIVAVEIPDIDSDDLEVLVLGTRLIFRGSARSNFFRQIIDLPCDVEMHPIRITDGKGTLYFLLVKKQGADTVKEEGYGGRYPSIPVLTVSGA